MNDKVIKRSLSDQVYNLIIQKIRSGNLKVGERINIEEMAREFGTSRTPVREALGMLAQSGFVEQCHLVGPRVADFTGKKAVELIQVNNILFDGLLPMVIANCDLSALADQLEEVFAKQEAAFQEHDSEIFFKYSIQFHEVLIQACPNKKLAALTEQTQKQLDVYVATYQNREENMFSSLEEHRKILTLLREQRTDELISAFSEHNQKALESFH